MRRGFIQKYLYNLAPLPQYRRKTHYLVLSAQTLTVNVSIDANIVDLDQTAPTGALFVYETSNILEHRFCDYASPVCIL